MALVLPLLVLLALGAVDLGRVSYDAVNVASAARAGLSYGSLNAAHAQDTPKITEFANADALNVNGISYVIGRICQCDDATCYVARPVAEISGSRCLKLGTKESGMRAIRRVPEGATSTALL